VRSVEGASTRRADAGAHLGESGAVVASMRS
jgi:hypothetical protein